MKIKNIQKGSVIPTVDIEVGNTHSYQLSNGAVSHNTLSLLAGSTPGIHPGFSRYYIRRVRMSSSDTLVPMCRNLGYHVEYAMNFDGTENRDTVVVSFPCEYSEETVLTKDMPAVRQLELVKNMQTIWADNSVSVTVYYKKEELPEIKEWLKENYENCVKSVSFLLHSDHGFAQAPYEEIDEKRYRDIKKRVKALDNIQIEFSEEELGGLGCEMGGTCPIK